MILPLLVFGRPLTHTWRECMEKERERERREREKEGPWERGQEEKGDMGEGAGRERGDEREEGGRGGRERGRRVRKRNDVDNGSR